MKVLKILKEKFHGIFKGIVNFIKTTDWIKVFWNIVMTAILPIILFTIPVTTGKHNSWGNSMMVKLNQGILLSSTISIASGIVLSFQPKVKTVLLDLFSETGENIKTEDSLKKLLPIYTNITVIVLSFILF